MNLQVLLPPPSEQDTFELLTGYRSRVSQPGIAKDFAEGIEEGIE